MKLWFKLDDGQLVLKECRLDRVLGRLCTLKGSHGTKEVLLPAGHRMKIRGFDKSGWWLQGIKPCEHCGVTGRISAMAWESIVIDGPVPAPPTKKALDAALALGGERAVEQMKRAWARIRHYDGDDADDD